MIIGGFLLVYIGREVEGYEAIIGSITIAIGSIIWNKQKIKIKISDEIDVLSFCFQYILIHKDIIKLR